MTTLLAPPVDAPAHRRPQPFRADSDRAVLNGLVLVAGIVGAAGRLSGNAVIGASGLVVFALLAPGAAVLTFYRPPGRLAGRLCLAFGISYTLLTVVSMVEVYTGWWSPLTSAILIATVSGVFCATAFARDLPHALVIARDELPGLRRTLAGRAMRIWLALAVGGTALCVVAALVSRDGNPPVGGFLRTVNPGWYLGIVALTVASGMGLLRYRADAGRVPVVGSALLLPVVITLTPSIIYDAPRSQSAEKHVQLSELIASSHHLVASETIYNDWPGLFTTSAMLKAFAGIGDLISLAAWWPVLLIVFRVVPVRLLAGRFVADPRTAWLVSTVVFLGTPNGLDYFSPQSVAYALGITTLWLATTPRLALRDRILLVLALTVGVVITHQLTPYIVGGALVFLALFRQLVKWWLPAVVLVPTVAWTLIHFEQVKYYISPSGVGSSSNFALPSSRAASPQLVVHIAIALAALGVLIIGLPAFLAFVRNIRRGWAWGLGVATLTGFGAVAVNAYGNEGTFRAVFFALPWLGILAGITVSRTFTRGWRIVRVVFVASFGGLVALCLIALFVLDSSNVIRHSDRAFLLGIRAEAQAHPHRRVVAIALGDANSPGVEAGEHPNFGVSRLELTGLVRHYPPNGNRFASQLAKRVRPYLKGQRNGSLYVFASPAVTAYEIEYGQLTSTETDEVLGALRRSPLWKVTFDEQGTVALRLRTRVLDG